MEQITWEEAMRRGRVAMEEWLRKDVQPVVKEEQEKEKND